MKIITATAATQGRRINDYNFCVEGEVVMPPIIICRSDRDDPDGQCGCGRGWCGANSHRGTTTAAVREVPFTMSDYTEAIWSSLEQSGWWPTYVDNEGVREMVTYLVEIAAAYPVGAVLEMRLDVVAQR
jgi:hypothetical protein